MAAAKPVISFAGSAKSLVHGYSGYIAKNHDVQDLARGISFLLENPEIAKTLGERARQSLTGVFDWGTIANGVADVYRQLINGRKELSRHSLSKHLKSSYTPVLEEQRKVCDFVIEGHLVYPTFRES
jgi:hypothetical protein